MEKEKEAMAVEQMQFVTDEQRQQMVSPEPTEATDQEEQVEKVDQIEWDFDLFKKLTETEQGRKEIQRAMDKNFTKGLETWKTNQLPKIIEAEVEAEIERRFPTDENERRIMELTNELKVKESKEVCVKTLAEAGLDIRLADHFASLDITNSQKMVDLFVEDYRKAFKEDMQRFLKTIGGTPKTNHQSSQRIMTKQEFLSLPYDKRAELYQSDPATYNRLMNSK